MRETEQDLIESIHVLAQHINDGGLCTHDVVTIGRAALLAWGRERGVDITADAGRPRKYQFYDLAVGQKIFVEGQNSQGSVASCARIHGKKHSKGFACRTREGGVLITRIF